MNVEIGTEAAATPFLGIFISNFQYCVFAVWDIFKGKSRFQLNGAVKGIGSRDMLNTNICVKNELLQVSVRTFSFFQFKLKTCRNFDSTIHFSKIILKISFSWPNYFQDLVPVFIQKTWLFLFQYTSHSLIYGTLILDRDYAALKNNRISH